MLPKLKHFVACSAIWMASQAAAHDLPISGMQMVADEHYLHVELMVNSAELVFFRELDQDKNGQLEVAEVNDHADEIARRIVDCLTLQTGGREIQPDVVGIVPDFSTHHLTVRAHYPVDARCVPISVESRLWEITWGAHSTQVTFATTEGSQQARLDARSPRVIFSETQKPDLPHGSAAGNSMVSTNAPCGGLSLGIAVGLAALIGGCLVCLRFHKSRT